MIKLTRPDCPNQQALNAKNYKHPDNKKALATATNNKCMYCESCITHIDFGDVEQIKPKADDKYPSLAYEWSNLGLACGKCNNAKSSKFFDEAPFIDPFSENPDEHLIALGAIITQRNGSERGEITIREIALNRPELLEKRMERMQTIIVALNAAHRTQLEMLKSSALAELEKEAQSDKEYSLIVKALLRANAG